MAPPKRPWFRYYVETFTDMDFRAMPYAHRLTWNAVMGLARSSPVPGVLLDKAGEPVAVAYLADFAAVKLAEARAALQRFAALGWVRQDGAALIVVNWDKRQFESDDVSTRVAKHRAAKNGDVTPDGTTKERSSLTGTEVQSSQKSSSSSSTSTGPAEAVDEDEVLDEALMVLAKRDLERREADRGAVGDRSAWLATAHQRRWERHATDAEGFLLARPGLSAGELAELLEPAPPVPPEDRRCGSCGGRFAAGTGWLHDSSCALLRAEAEAS